MPSLLSVSHLAARPCYRDNAVKIVPGWLDYGRAGFLRAYPQTPGLDDAGHRDDGMHPSRPYSGRTEVRLSSAPTRSEAGAFAANDGVARLGSGGGTYRTVHLRPQVQAGAVNSALQCAYRASGRARSFFVTLLFDSYHTKGFFLFSRQALEGDVKLAQFGSVVLRSRDTHLRHCRDRYTRAGFARRK